MITIIKEESFDSKFHNLKDEKDLMWQIFAYTKDDIKLIKNYTDNEINKMAIHMILKGLLRGSFDNGKAFWRKLTPQGEIAYNQLKKEKNY